MYYYRWTLEPLNSDSMPTTGDGKAESIPQAKLFTSLDNRVFDKNVRWKELTGTSWYKKDEKYLLTITVIKMHQLTS